MNKLNGHKTYIQSSRTYVQLRNGWKVAAGQGNILSIEKLVMEIWQCSVVRETIMRLPV